MKKLFLFAALLMAVAFSAQNAEPIKYSEVVQVDSGKNAKYLLANAKMWFSKTFVDPREIIILDDSENNILMGRGYLKYDSKIMMGSIPRAGWISFDVIISCKDGRYKYDFTNFTHTGQAANASFGVITNEEFFPTMKGTQGGIKSYKVKVADEIKSFCAAHAETLVSSLKLAMNETISTKDDW